MNNYKFTIQYDGTNYSGWQIQDNAITVQQTIADAIKVILKEEVNLIGSGRTDAGVHALGQVANFRCAQELDLYKFHYSLNSILPNDISIKQIIKVDESFHARFDAKKRSYIYLFTSNKNPFYQKYSYMFPQIKNISFENLNRLSKVLIGKHDFTSFSRKNEEQENKFCTIEEIYWRIGNDVFLFYISADRFLHGMVRTIIGTILKAAEINYSENYLLDVLNKKDRCKADESVPAKGLFLFKVRY
jgi:tRNA pseudouridine38-40 synthase